MDWKTKTKTESHFLDSQIPAAPSFVILASLCFLLNLKCTQQHSATRDRLKETVAERKWHRRTLNNQRFSEFVPFYLQTKHFKKSSIYYLNFLHLQIKPQERQMIGREVLGSSTRSTLSCAVIGLSSTNQKSSSPSLNSLPAWWPWQPPLRRRRSEACMLGNDGCQNKQDMEMNLCHFEIYLFFIMTTK